MNFDSVIIAFDFSNHTQCKWHQKGNLQFRLTAIVNWIIRHKKQASKQTNTQSNPLSHLQSNSMFLCNVGWIFPVLFMSLFLSAACFFFFLAKERVHLVAHDWSWEMEAGAFKEMKTYNKLISITKHHDYKPLKQGINTWRFLIKGPLFFYSVHTNKNRKDLVVRSLVLFTLL